MPAIEVRSRVSESAEQIEQRTIKSGEEAGSRELEESSSYNRDNRIICNCIRSVAAVLSRWPRGPTSTGEPYMKQVVFLHLDLGIGGAESLVLNLAKAILPSETNHDKSSASARHRDGSNGCDISIYTTHCSPSHCYDEVKPDGALAPFVRIRGSWLPRKFIFGGTALCSSIRMLYLTYRAAAENPNASVFVIDVLPTGVPYLVNYCKSNAGVLFYCHFPDKLLTRDTVNGEEVALRSTVGTDRNEMIALLCKCFSIMKAIYRWAMDAIEESAMAYADLVAVNSKFTKCEVERVFPSFIANNEHVKVLYPAIESTLSKKRRMKQRSSGGNCNESFSCRSGPIVSLNRFERKKNVALLLHAYGVLLERASKKGKATILPPLIVAGGYDPLNIENVEHLAELRGLADEILDRHSLPPSVVLSPKKSGEGLDDVFENASITFMPSVSNAGRSRLLRCASVWCYTPHREHFGIVPLEAMDAGLPVVAINSGGPMETIVDGVTGCLVEYSPLGSSSPSDNETVKGFADAIEKILSDSVSAMKMGKNGQQRVDSIFGMETFREKWWDLLVEAQNRGVLRQRSQCASYPDVLMRFWSIFVEGLLVFTFILLVTYGLREAKLIDKDVTLARALGQQYQKLFNLDEL